MSLSQNGHIDVENGHIDVAYLAPARRALSRTNAPPTDPDRLEQRLGLIGDLADALAKQIARVRTDLETSAPSPALMHRVSEQQDLVHDAVEQLLNLQTLVPVKAPRSAPGPVKAPRSTPAPVKAPRSEAGPDYLRRQPSAMAVALELRLAGMSRPEVERYLEDNFRVSNAPEIGLFVFGSQPGQSRLPRPAKKLLRRWRSGQWDFPLLPP